MGLFCIAGGGRKSPSGKAAARHRQTYKAGFQIKDNGNGFVADAHAVDAHINKLQEVLAGTDAAAALDFTLAVHFLHHHLYDLEGRAFGFEAGQKAGAGFYKIGAGLHTAMA